MLNVNDRYYICNNSNSEKLKGLKNHSYYKGQIVDGVLENAVKIDVENFKDEYKYSKCDGKVEYDSYIDNDVFNEYNLYDVRDGPSNLFVALEIGRRYIGNEDKWKNTFFLKEHSWNGSVFDKKKFYNN